MPNILITGGNRGLGFGLVTHYLSLPNNTVIASVRNNSSASALTTLPTGPGSRLIVITISSTSSTSALSAIASLSQDHNISTLDLVIANAGIAEIYPRVQHALPADMLRHYEVNVIGPVLLFQAALPLLAQEGMFVSLGSSAGTLGDMESLPIPNAAYGPSKTALSWVTRKMHFEHEGLVVFTMHPGWVQTEMGNAGAVAIGMEKAILTLDESVQGMVKVIAAATRENSGGRFMNYDGNQSIW